MLADQREQHEFLRDAGELDIARLGELPADHGNGCRPVAREPAVVVLLVPGRQGAADRGVRVALARLALSDRGEALVEISDRGVP